MSGCVIIFIVFIYICHFDYKLQICMQSRQFRVKSYGETRINIGTFDHYFIGLRLIPSSSTRALAPGLLVFVRVSRYSLCHNRHNCTQNCKLEPK